MLSKIEKHKVLPEERSAKIITQILAAIALCHAKNIMHRDLKPENVLFEYDSIESTVKVADFGRSKVLKTDVKITERAGSIYYVAPEVLLRKDYNEKCDIWSTGVILYLLLTGTLPFRSIDKNEIAEQITKGEVNFNGISSYSYDFLLLENAWMKVSNKAKDFVKKLLMYDPKERISAEDALKDEWICENKDTNEIRYAFSLKKLKSFNTQTTLQRAVLSYIASQRLSKEEEKLVREAFDSIDTDKDGKLSRVELIACYEKVHGDRIKAEKAVDQMMERIDFNRNGFIDYNGKIIKKI